jgi:ABC-type enterochelin transport system ATPase subunit
MNSTLAKWRAKISIVCQTNAYVLKGITERLVKFLRFRVNCGFMTCNDERLNNKYYAERLNFLGENFVYYSFKNLRDFFFDRITPKEHKKVMP